MMQHRKILTLLSAVSAAGVLCLGYPVQAQPSADQVLTDMGLSADDKQKVLNGEFVTSDVQTVSDRDLSIAIAFLVKVSPDALVKQILAGDFVTTDPQVRAHGEFKSPGSLADLGGLQVTADEAQKLSGAQAGSALNLSTSEIAAFNVVQGGAAQAVQAAIAADAPGSLPGLPGIRPGGNRSL